MNELQLYKFNRITSMAMQWLMFISSIIFFFNFLFGKELIYFFTSLFLLFFSVHFYRISALMDKDLIVKYFDAIKKEQEFLNTLDRRTRRKFGLKQVKNEII